MKIQLRSEAQEALASIGYYRLRGYCYPFYDTTSKQFKIDINFSDLIRLYDFDTELSHLIFRILSDVEVALRARLTEALLIYKDALILTDPVIFNDKNKFWKNSSTIS